MVPLGSPAIFDGSAGLSFTDNVPTVAQTFSIAISFSQQGGGSGYLFAKHAEGSPRLYSAFLSVAKEEGDPHELVFLYTAVGAVAGAGVTATARFPLAADAKLSDGLPHHLLLAVGGGGVTVRIDGSEPTSQRLLGKSVKDCTTPHTSSSASSSSRCTLTVGAATGDSFRFVGTVFGGKFEFVASRCINQHKSTCVLCCVCVACVACVFFKGETKGCGTAHIIACAAACTVGEPVYAVTLLLVSCTPLQPHLCSRLSATTPSHTLTHTLPLFIYIYIYCVQLVIFFSASG